MLFSQPLEARDAALHPARRVLSLVSTRARVCGCWRLSSAPLWLGHWGGCSPIHHCPT